MIKLDDVKVIGTKNGVTIENWERLVPIMRIRYKIRMKSKRIQKKYLKRLVNEALRKYLREQGSNV